MDFLAIESSCDETAAAVVRDGRQVRSSVIHSQAAEHGLYGGVVPEIASRRHIENVVWVVEAALKEANCSLKELSGIAVTAAPGLIGALLVGVNYAKGLCLSGSLPLIPVHHLRGHIAANYIEYPDLTPPYTALVVSGGHSHLVKVEDYTRFSVLGRTRDDAPGETYDKVARALGLGYPGGVLIDKLSKEGDPKQVVLPTPQLSGNKLDFSFSGIKTAIVNLLHNAQQKGESLPTADVAAALNQKIADILTTHAMAALDSTGDKILAVSGGVSANSLLRERLGTACEKRGVRLCLPPLSLCGDNAAMIGAQGYYQYQAGLIGSLSQNAFACMELEEEFV